MNFWKRTFATLAAFAILLGAVPELPRAAGGAVFAADEDTEAVGPNDKTAFLVTLADGKTRRNLVLQRCPPPAGAKRTVRRQLTPRRYNRKISRQAEAN